MKTQKIYLSWRRRMYVAYSNESARILNRIKTVLTEKKDNHFSSVENTAEHLKKTDEFHRKAFMGNYFAGPYCIFDPRLL